MGHEVVVLDVSVLRGLWETRVRRQTERQKKEAERLERSALHRIKEEWDVARELRNRGPHGAAGAQNVLFIAGGGDKLSSGDDQYSLPGPGLGPARDRDRSKFVFELTGEQWTEFPEALRKQVHLREWNVRSTSITTIPPYIENFLDVTVLTLSQNLISHLPAQIGG
ncbi:leucine-rich repeat-containing protein 2 [Ornithorhynchus anatinus]|uniref:leucine-rich repeat-containing protein 2 n=1 Tax=Ornithorhynchus anatinus TaxID=9258 RepID=UPI0010A7EFBF|nr:leucine-rich repeat-containing protein 2 [Ornithorhynchus anatinus]XP_028911757.1 leucine-rich repeat-containing protein 2 [Ornithorhynchus anatinus]